MDLDFKILYNKITETLKQQLPSHLTYHDINHTLYVLDRAIYIANKEKISEHELKLIKVAALFHDIGFIKSHIDHEKKSTEYARHKLSNYNFSKADIDRICGMIMATKIPQTPKNLLEKIIADADLEYLSTNSFKVNGDRLYKELKHYNNKLTRKEWNKIQIQFLKAHSYHTKYCKQYKEFRKNKNLDILIQENL
ncbi:HD domain-containing protein [Lacinutrix iliipiscaria]|uniref:HD domain-containing protein n=1 Tax=Lacinutrix iliipiscaria TaxID=1230532 RepID=A0ABW5WLT0_9FLAO